MGELPKQISRWCWGGFCIGAFIGYTIEFAPGTKHVGFIFLYVFIVLLCILGVVGAVLENNIIAWVFTVIWPVLVIIDAHYLGAFYALILGQLAAAFGIMVAIGGGGGGGK